PSIFRAAWSGTDPAARRRRQALAKSRYRISACTRADTVGRTDHGKDRSEISSQGQIKNSREGKSQSDQGQNDSLGRDRAPEERRGHRELLRGGVRGGRSKPRRRGAWRRRPG